MTMTKAAKLTPTQTAYLHFLNGTGKRPQCAYGTVEAKLRKAGLAENVLIPGQQYALMTVITEAGKAAIANA